MVFYGKALIIRGLVLDNHIYIATLVAASGLIVFYSLVRIFLNIFYDNINKTLQLRPLPKGILVPLVSIVAVAFLIGIFSNQLDGLINNSVQMILDPKKYIEIVLGKGA